MLFNLKGVFGPLDSEEGGGKGQVLYFLVREGAMGRG